MKARTDKAIHRLWMALCILCATLASLTVCLTGTYWNDLWYSGSFYRSMGYQYATQEYVDAAHALANLTITDAHNGQLSYLQEERAQALGRTLDPAETNFRMALFTQEGEPLGGSLLPGEQLDQVVDAGSLSTVAITLHFNTEGRTQPRPWPLPQQDADPHINTEGDPDSLAPASVTAVLEYGVLKGLPVADSIQAARQSYDRLRGTWLPLIAAVAVASCVLGLAMLPKLWRATRRRVSQSLRGQDRVPFDLYLLAVVLLALLLALPGGDILALFFQTPFRPVPLVGLILLFALYAFLGLSLFCTLAARWGRRPWQSTLLYRGAAALGRQVRALLRSLAFRRRLTLFFVLFVLGEVLLCVLFILTLAWGGFWPLPLLLWVVYNVLVLGLLGRWVRQWQEVRDYTARLLSDGGQVQPLEDARYFSDLRDHAAQLGSLARAVDEAVERETQSQRFQTELITNVSHDLKSPLTSIVNYVDLLQKTDPADPAVPGYLEVLDRKSQRLKKLTEDLIEASKASSGVLPVALAPIGLAELLDQAMGEYRERLTQLELEPVVAVPDREVTVLADGRHLWRVVDNLLSNCAKYSMPGTRVYLSVAREEGWGAICLKNVSAQPLNLPPQELLHRFVRGDASRNTEGTGLGLSIAQSLTQLQGGVLELEIDGDLFKAAVKLPLAEPDGDAPGEGTV